MTIMMTNNSRRLLVSQLVALRAPIIANYEYWWWLNSRWLTVRLLTRSLSLTTYPKRRHTEVRTDTRIVHRALLSPGTWYHTAKHLAFGYIRTRVLEPHRDWAQLCTRTAMHHCIYGGQYVQVQHAKDPPEIPFYSTCEYNVRRVIMFLLRTSCCTHVPGT